MMIYDDLLNGVPRGFDPCNAICAVLHAHDSELHLRACRDEPSLGLSACLHLTANSHMKWLQRVSNKIRVHASMRKLRWNNIQSSYPMGMETHFTIFHPFKTFCCDPKIPENSTTPSTPISQLIGLREKYRKLPWSSWENLWFPVNFPLNQPIEYQFQPSGAPQNSFNGSSSAHPTNEAILVVPAEPNFITWVVVGMIIPFPIYIYIYIIVMYIYIYNIYIAIYMYI